MDKIILSVLFILCTLNQYGQTLTLTFTGRDADTQNNVELSSVQVENLTAGCDTIVFGPSPTLVLNMISGIHENNLTPSYQVMPNMPNLFIGSTMVSICIPTDSS